MGEVIKLGNYKPDMLLNRIRKARAASRLRLDFLADNDGTDREIGAELGFQEAMDMVEYWHNRKHD